MRAWDHQQAAVAGEDIVEVGEDDKVVAEDTAFARVVARALPAEILAGAMQAQRLVLVAVD